MRQVGNYMREIDHLHFHPEDSVSIAAADGALPTTLEGHYSSGGHFTVDVNIYNAAATMGTFGVYVWDEAQAKSLLFLIQSFNTAANCVYRIEVGGRPFFIKHLSGVACTYSYTLL